jgi:magnesium-transporting ATPase (P-type)
MTTPIAPRSPLSVGRALLVTWLVTAAWDFLCASALSVVAYGSTFSRLWHGVAAAVLGPAAFDMGARGVAVGLALHLTVAFVWSAVFVLALATSAVLRRTIARPSGALAVAAVYGPVIWLVMSLAVIPLATGKPPVLAFRWWVQVFAHIPFVTLPLVFTARRAFGLTEHGRVANESVAHESGRLV